MSPVRFLCWGIVAAVAGLVGEAHAGLKVAATVPGLAALAREVGGAHVTVDTMSLPTQDPHFVDARPSLTVTLNRADLVLLLGLDLEVGWLPKLLVGARNPNIQVGSRGYLDCSAFVRVMDVPQQAVDRSMGDIHPAGNPHYLLDPRAAAAVALGIAQRMAELDPEHASDFKEQAAVFTKRLSDKRARWETRLASVRGAPLIGYHRTLTYFADWLGFELVGYLEPKPGIPPNPQHVARLLALARARKVRVIVQESYSPDLTSQTVAAKVPATLLRIPGDVDLARAETYVGWLDGILGRLAQAFGVP